MDGSRPNKEEKKHVAAKGGVKKVTGAKATATARPVKTPKPVQEKRTGPMGTAVRFKAQPTVKDLERIMRALPGAFFHSHIKRDAILQ